MFIATDNQFTARGRLVDSPQINISEKTGNAIVSITLAQEHPFKKKEAGERESVFIKYTAIDTKNNPIASRIAEYVTKGSLVSLIGYHDSYYKENSEGKKEYFEVKRISTFRNEESKEKTLERRTKA
ncbi:single-stranded DNA-binding protein [Lactococcus cremoris]|uniref:single-stranded DNA-binding protein n=1 Tax=Lactococcus lactis subsp. cremoris TaxID=1359 RepID=UPI002870EB0F|nr:single-stranded DNA-binding protein [Lactococcus cremoris]MDR9868074.1 single-stranded DNA-binding protein [Lactococcus cremoris]